MQLYTRLTELAGNLNLSDLAYTDTDWATQREESNRRELARLESELRGYKNNLIRESIRMGQEDLATHHLATGGPSPDSTASAAPVGLPAAYTAFGRMRDYCTTPAHINGMTLHLAYTALVQAVSATQIGQPAASHFSSLRSNSERLRGGGAKPEEQGPLTAVSYVLGGIASLGQGQYEQAARTFLATPFSYHNIGKVASMIPERTIASANDVAIYGGLCALATLSRDDLVNSVLAGPFRSFLEQEPHMRQAIGLYTMAKYQACLATLRRYYSDWSCDVYLGSILPSENQRSTLAQETHLDHLLAQIRQRSVTAYFSSYSRVSLEGLAATFPPITASATNPTAALESEILSLIHSGVLNARLDLSNPASPLLVAPPANARSEAHAEARAAATDIERTLQLRLHKVNMVLAGLEVPKPPKGMQTAWDERQRGGGGGGDLFVT